MNGLKLAMIGGGVILLLGLMATWLMAGSAQAPEVAVARSEAVAVSEHTIYEVADKSESSKKSEKKAAAPEPEPEPEPEPPEPEVIPLVRVLSVPEGAEVSLEGTFLGTTPLQVSRPVEGELLQLELELRGHRPLKIALESFGPDEMSFALKKKRVRKKQRVPSREKKLKFDFSRKPDLGF